MSFNAASTPLAVDMDSLTGQIFLLDENFLRFFFKAAMAVRPVDLIQNITNFALSIGFATYALTGCGMKEVRCTGPATTDTVTATAIQAAAVFFHKCAGSGMQWIVCWCVGIGMTIAGSRFTIGYIMLCGILRICDMHLAMNWR